MVTKYIRKPDVVEAIQFTGTEENHKEILDFISAKNISAEGWFGNTVKDLWVRNNPRQVEINDFIIKKDTGEISICKYEDFYKKYDQVEVTENDSDS